MAINRQKISQMTPKGADLDPTDLLEVSVQTGSGYDTYSITGQEIINAAAAGTGTVTSVDLTMPSAFTVTGNPITTAGTLAVAGAGVVSQYVRGDGSLANFPTTSGGGASVSYYLNGSVSQGTFGGVAMKEINKTPIIGTGTDFTINANGYIQSFITDANDPNQLSIPAGNWNFETYFSASSNGGSPSFYVELYKWDGATLTLIASNSTNPEGITGGTAIDLYLTALSIPQTTLAATDRLVVRIYVTHSGRTITLHTENSHLSQIITTFSTGLTALNGLTAQVQNLAVGTSGTDFAISSVTSTHTFNLPTASATNRGALSTADWTTFNGKQDTLISATNIKTINGNTLLGSGDLVIGGGITVGTTAVTSGTIGRVFFQGTGDVVQQSANLFWDNTNSRLGLGATPASTVRLDVRSQGALTTDIAFRIRNSANTKNLANITGLGDVYLGDGVTVTNQGTAPLIAIGSTTTVNGVFNSSPIAIGNNTTAIGNSIALGKGSSAGSSGVDNNIAIGYNALATGPSNTIVIGANVSGSTYAGNSIIVGHSMTTTSQARANIVFGRYMNSVQGFINEAFAFGSGVSDASRASLDVGDSFSIYINQNTRALFLNQKSNLVFRNGQSLTSGTHFEAAATNTFTIHNGTAPITNLVDAFQQYSADVVAGNAAPHFRTENGGIIKLYKETTAVTAATFVTNTSAILNDSATFDGYTIGQVVKALRNLGILA